MNFTWDIRFSRFTQVKNKRNFNWDIRFPRFTEVKNKGNFNRDIKFSRYTQVKNKGNFNWDIRFSASNQNPCGFRPAGGRRSAARSDESGWSTARARLGAVRARLDRVWRLRR